MLNKMCLKCNILALHKDDYVNDLVYWHLTGGGGVGGVNHNTRITGLWSNNQGRWLEPLTSKS